MVFPCCPNTNMQQYLLAIGQDLLTIGNMEHAESRQMCRRHSVEFPSSTLMFASFIFRETGYQIIFNTYKKVCSLCSV